MDYWILTRRSNLVLVNKEKRSCQLMDSSRSEKVIHQNEYLDLAGELKVTVVISEQKKNSSFLFLIQSVCIYPNPQPRTGCDISKLVTVVEGDQKAPFSIATTLRCRRGCYSFPWIAPLYPWYIPYNSE